MGVYIMGNGFKLIVKVTGNRCGVAIAALATGVAIYLGPRAIEAWENVKRAEAQTKVSPVGG